MCGENNRFFIFAKNFPEYFRENVWGNSRYFRQLSRKCENENFRFNSTTKPSWRPYIVFNLQHFFSDSFFSIQFTSDVFLLILFIFFGLFRNRCAYFGCFETDPKHRKKNLFVSRTPYFKVMTKLTALDWKEGRAVLWNSPSVFVAANSAKVKLQYIQEIHKLN
jgi:hypothetical protein